jgi:RNA polymerase sigma factor (sigma-70 family)
MVHGVCRRVLRHAHDAEDAFQATFLILARKARSVVQRETLGCWLHRVAYRVALEAAAINVRRRSMERQVEKMPQPAITPEEPRDWQPIMDQELNGLPWKYRSAIVLCDLEGRTRTEAARQLGVPVGTLSGRLTTARRMLAERLTRRGFVVSGAALAAGMTQAASTRLSAALVMTTARAAALVAAGQLAAVSTEAAVLMTGVLKAMLMEKVRLSVVAILATVVLAVGGLAGRFVAAPAAAQAPTPAKRAADKPANELEVLRKKVELLELNLEVVLEKVRAQEREIRSLKEKLNERNVVPTLDPLRPDGTRKGGPNTPKDPFRPDGNRKGGPSPPPAEVKGKINKADGNLVTITIGSDAGLKRGQTLEVYRLGTEPRYIGRIKIIELTPTRAVGQAAGRMLEPMQSGDEVAGRLEDKK